MSLRQQQSREMALEAAGGSSPMHAPRQQIYPQSVSGVFRNIKWALLVATLAVYYLLPFVRWHRGPSEPSQAVLVDLDHSRFYFFFIEIWPQEVYYFTGLLILAAMTLFLMNAVAGRLWCGYLCPQTIWTDLFLLVERSIEGDRRERMKAAEGPWTRQRLTRAVRKHATWLLIAWWTGGAWVLYFNDAPTLVRQLATFTAPPIAWIWIGILTFTTYFLAGHMREQVCTYLCPWPRIQAALTDEWALNVAYRYDRGEPRGSAKKNDALRLAGAPAGDCVDCHQCVAVCPTGVDIRDGLQLDCIQCGLCIDACDAVMLKVGRPERLIAYDTDVNIRRRAAGLPGLPTRFVRARTVLYAAMIAIVGSIMLYALTTRGSQGLAVMHDRNPMFVQLSNGAIRNAYTVRISNKNTEPRRFMINVGGLEGAQIEGIGAAVEKDGALILTAGPDQTLETRVLVTAPLNVQLPPSQNIVFSMVDLKTSETVKVADHFLAP
ncbi:cytochrome c oxidase accessory protein CcoG [Methylocapsa palsarum]|uniref:Cytochrome c oxidase accessory protein FixG n=1 Tax=Methylocapsa palsarum TaxID=1612308 RepID=A0A1I3ZAC0_9HYPH|nr:cytochrome c oxidase accessory protein CcoG [Methylocapsa palsarum]SFK40955.1 cytochrome c oxidase accessory protein FixG [Methylocapsa palsarum]